MKVWLEVDGKELPLLAPDLGGEIESRIAQFLPTWMSQTPNGALFNRRITSKCCEPLQPLHVHSNDLPEPALGLNQLYVPTGMHRWSRMYSLMRWKDLRLIYSDYYAVQPTKFCSLDWEIKQQTDQFQIGRKRLYHFFVSRAVQVSHSVLDATHDDNDVYLVELVDDRYTLQHRVMQYVPESNWSWAAIASQLDAASDSDANDSFLELFSDFPGAPDRNYLHRPGESLAVIAQAAFESFGKTTTPPVWDGDLRTFSLPFFVGQKPEKKAPKPKMEIHFVRKVDGRIRCDEPPFVFAYGDDEATGDFDPGPVIVHSSAIADFEAGGTSPTNLAGLTSIANEIAKSRIQHSFIPHGTPATSFLSIPNFPQPIDSYLIDFSLNSGGVFVPSSRRPVARFRTSYAVDKQTVKDCSGDGIVRFQLIAPLYLCESAYANVLSDEKPLPVESDSSSAGEGSAESSSTEDCPCEPVRVIDVRDVAGLASLVQNMGWKYAPPGSMGYARPLTCVEPSDPPVYELISIGVGCCESDSAPSGSEFCMGIPGVDLDSIPIVNASDVDYVLAIKDGCLVKVALSECDPGSSV